ncbi:MAG: KamA family radical SAM protein, partial [Lentisphaeria bacterium]|nr:KamA family radical SAM protein [Lentisphaeria bacterium]
MEKWRNILRRSLTDPAELARRFGAPATPIRNAAEKFPLRISPHYLSLIREAGDALYRQCVPDERELEYSPDLLEDPLGEEARSPAPCIVHRYVDHCLFLVSNECATYCRFCTRKRRFGCGGARPIGRDELAAGIAYVAAHPEIRDVLVSGGDPLLLEDGELDAVLTSLRTIPHVEIIRIGTRVPCMLPERITNNLCRMLKKHHPLYVNVHFNHPDELVEPSIAALGRLADAGIVLGSQTVLLRGVNDDPAVMKKLMEKLLAARVRPYYLLQMDLVRGGEHFRTPLETGVKIIDALRGHTSGLAVPHFIIDLPEGRGKVEMIPQYLRHRNGRTVI